MPTSPATGAESCPGERPTRYGRSTVLGRGRVDGECGPQRRAVAEITRDREYASGGIDPVLQAGQPAAAGGIGPPNTVVAHFDDQQQVVDADAHACPARCGVLDHICERFGDDEVCRGLGLRRQTRGREFEIYGCGYVGNERLKTAPQSGLAERSRQDSVDQLSQLGVGPFGVAQGLVDQVGSPASPWRPSLARVSR